MTDEELTKLVIKLSQTLATKDDLVNFATKDDLVNFATKDDLVNFATKDDLKDFAKKEDLGNFATKDDIGKLDSKMDKYFSRLNSKITELDAKADVILEYATGVDEITQNHEKRLKKIEQIPSIAPHLK